MQLFLPFSPKFPPASPRGESGQNGRISAPFRKNLTKNRGKRPKPMKSPGHGGFAAVSGELEVLPEFRPCPQLLAGIRLRFRPRIETGFCLCFSPTPGFGSKSGLDPGAGFRAGVRLRGLGGCGIVRSQPRSRGPTGGKVRVRGWLRLRAGGRFRRKRRGSRRAPWSRGPGGTGPRSPAGSAGPSGSPGSGGGSRR